CVSNPNHEPKEKEKKQKLHSGKDSYPPKEQDTNGSNPKDTNKKQQRPSGYKDSYSPQDQDTNRRDWSNPKYAQKNQKQRQFEQDTKIPNLRPTSSNPQSLARVGIP